LFGRDIDDELVEQLELIPKVAAACGFANMRRHFDPTL
jgi:hypothetical protein